MEYYNFDFNVHVFLNIRYSICFLNNEKFNRIFKRNNENDSFKKGLHIGFYYIHVKSREFIYLFLKMCLLFFADEN